MDVCVCVCPWAFALQPSGLPAEGCYMNIIGSPVASELSGAQTSFITPITTKTPPHGKCINTNTVVPKKQICAATKHAFSVWFEPGPVFEFWGQCSCVMSLSVGLF